jgi:hypothetical protein
MPKRQLARLRVSEGLLKAIKEGCIIFPRRCSQVCSEASLEG